MGKPKLRKPLALFADAMEAQLVANDHKGGWHESGTDWLLDRSLEEWWELSDALRLFRAAKHASEERMGRESYWKAVNEATEKVVKEAADVANFCMMIADNARSYERAVRYALNKDKDKDEGKTS